MTLQDEINADLFNAVTRANLHDIKEAIRAGADLFNKNENGLTALQYARTFGATPARRMVVEFLQNTMKRGF